MGIGFKLQTRRFSLSKAMCQVVAPIVGDEDDRENLASCKDLNVFFLILHRCLCKEVYVILYMNK